MKRVEILFTDKPPTGYHYWCENAVKEHLRANGFDDIKPIHMYTHPTRFDRMVYEQEES